MKITAIGSKKTKVGEHEIIKMKLGSLEPDSDGFISIVGNTNKLALSGHFDIEINFSPADLDAIAAAPTRTALATRIIELEKEIGELKNSN